MRKLVLVAFLLLSCSITFGQIRFSFQVIDSESNNPLIGATILIKGTTHGVLTNEEGKATFSDLPEGEVVFMVSYVGYERAEFAVTFPTRQKEPIVFQLTAADFDEVVIEATRANRSVANLPTRTEVLTEEIDEAASMEPSKIAHLITHSTGIQVQTTSATSNGAVVRIQGLNGRYTQMLKDGFPLYGGFSGSLDVLQIPPLDLRQVEYVKGPASTLYGGGAIGGIINLLTKEGDEDETLLHLNLSHIGARDFNAFASRKFGKFGFTNLASMHLHTPYDADDDGYTDVPEVAKFNFNPKLFFYPDEQTELYLGAQVMKDTRAGGDMELLNNAEPDTLHYYSDRQESNRYTSQFRAKREWNDRHSISLKNSVSHYDRFITIRQNAKGLLAQFSGDQLNSYSELNYAFNSDKHSLNIGANFITDQFTEERLTVWEATRDQEYTTLGVYANHLWDVNPSLATELGLRTDYASAKSEISENTGEVFVLPRLSILWKATPQLSIRTGGGLGYRMPTIFNEESEPFGYSNIQPIDFVNTTAERSYGGNFDVKYQSTFGSDHVLLTFNQMFFYNLIDNPILLTTQGTDLIYANVGDYVHSRGFESQIKLTVWKFTWFFGYTYTDAFIESNGGENALILTPIHSIKGDLLFVEDDKWRIGWDYDYKSEQFLSTGLQSPSLFATGVIVERTLNNFVIFLNAENFTDVRQSANESLLSGPYNTPQFTDIYAPLDGFFFNAGLKIKL